MQNDKVKTALGFSMRAGKCLTGAFAVERAVNGAKAKLIVVDEDASPATKEKFARLAGQVVPLIDVKDLGTSVGKEGKMVAAIIDAPFAAMIFKAWESKRE